MPFDPSKLKPVNSGFDARKLQPADSGQSERYASVGVSSNIPEYESKKPSQQVSEGIDSVFGKDNWLGTGIKVLATPATWAADVGTDLGNTAAQGVKTSWAGARRVAESFDPNSGEDAQQRVTRGVGGVFDVIGGGLQTAFSPAGAAMNNTPGLKQVGDLLSFGADNAAKGGSFLFKKALNIDDKSEEGEQIDKGFQLLAQLLPMKYGEAKLRQKQKLPLSMMDKGALKAGQVGATMAKAPLKAAGWLGTEALARFQGLEPDTLRRAAQMPEAFSKQARQQTGFDIANRFKSALDDRLDNLSELGKTYDDIRGSGASVQLPENWFKSQFDKWKLKVDEQGNIIADSRSLIRDKKNINALQEIYNRYGDKPVLGADEFLNLRSDISSLSKFSSEAQLPEVAARQMRYDLNNLREQVPGLKELDDQYSPEVKLLRDLKKKIENPDGSLRENAAGFIKSSINEGKQGRLKNLENVLSGLGEDVKNLNAVLDLEKAKGSKVGTYAKGAILGGGAFYAGGIPGVVASLVLTNPEVGIQLFRAMGKTKAAISSAFNVSKDYIMGKTRDAIQQEGISGNVVNINNFEKSVASDKVSGMSKVKVKTTEFDKAYNDEMSNVRAMINQRSQNGNISVQDAYDIIDRVSNIDENTSAYNIKAKQAIVSNLTSSIDQSTGGAASRIKAGIFEEVKNQAAAQDNYPKIPTTQTLSEENAPPVKKMPEKAQTSSLDLKKYHTTIPDIWDKIDKNGFIPNKYGKLFLSENRKYGEMKSGLFNAGEGAITKEVTLPNDIKFLKIKTKNIEELGAEFEAIRKLNKLKTDKATIEFLKQKGWYNMNDVEKSNFVLKLLKANGYSGISFVDALNLRGGYVNVIYDPNAIKKIKIPRN